MNELQLVELSKKIFEQNSFVGWWDNPDRCLYECLQLVSTEVAEATEGERKNLMDDHLPTRKMGEVELADALIRVLDLAGRLGLIVLEPMLYTELATGQSVGRLHLMINSYIVVVAEELELFTQAAAEGEALDAPNLGRAIWSLIAIIISVSDHLGYDIEAAMHEKLAYNKERADHKRENRKLENGKKF